MNSSAFATSLRRFAINLLFIVLTAFFHFFHAQSPDKAPAPVSTLLPSRTTMSENIVYKTSETGKSIAMDIYRPKTAADEKLPVLIYVHGGGWVQGNKSIPADTYIEDMILKLVERHYAVISIDYTLVSPDVHFPAPVQDCKDAIRWVRKNAEKYHFDTENIGLFGASAGAHLSLLAAYTDDTQFKGAPELAPYSAKVNYVVDNFGPADLNKLLHTRVGRFPAFLIGLFSKQIVKLRENLIRGISGYEIKTDKRKVIEYFKTISPVTYSSHGIPTLILQGNKDKIVPLQQSEKLSHQLNDNGVKNILVVVEEGVHGFWTTDKAYLKRLTDQMVDFVVSQKKNTAQPESAETKAAAK
ncbi:MULTISPECIES: alpha/beta hydrolase [Chryseobacterium]|uniref:Acetyl esterase/lipase n=1 Tax=Chryseobacterium camelliae TaxID=1265445 RepID=A0ABU0TLX5_9FLAO|nr:MULTISPECIES: alpha/beta hydrolase [Chryseobacterium]MDT3408878.1 acetyl esterase/lipase [Pseudacidovorax intermedius]MDQ1097265.1 acetyl esterase/lipase [Chryseobacterium camelliae]MDQ1101199.1 acetyl esterase/lipase [Chryseobacterium sp. SORGH_AS_1048]MDR6084645.1 acetyl esterase/lipase [Chryseobacterium sp. SORGH_AS_0909]MDR6132917.1 acetyl esterase/lipase [Chryseobacterium sp. SORGH_AS_1175]